MRLYYLFNKAPPAGEGFLSAIMKHKLQKKLLITSSSFDEAITRCVLKHKHAFDIIIEVITIQALLDHYHIHDELSDDGALIRWFKPNHPPYSNQTHVLLNRTLVVHQDLFLKFTEPDRDYAQREFEAYLGHAFSAFQGLDNQTVNGLAGTLLSLPEQWQRIQDKTATLHTPAYYWGPKTRCPLKNNLIYSDIYDVFNWSKKSSQANPEHLFCFKKPTGYPVLIASLGEQHLITSKQTPSTAIQKQLTAHLNMLRNCFNYFIFEALFFIAPDQIHFGCIHPDLTQSSKHSNFDAFIQQHLIHEYFKCLT
jgi:hypothetical protein